MTSSLTTIELFKEDMKFSVAHFTIFSATQRERLHGHNYQVRAAITANVDPAGLTFDYREYKQKLRSLCRELNEYTLLPTQSPHLKITEEQNYYHCSFNKEVIPFLQSDVKLMPLANITVEALSQWFLKKLIKDKSSLQSHCIQKIVISVSSGPGQSGSATYQLKESQDE